MSTPSVAPPGWGARSAHRVRALGGVLSDRRLLGMAVAVYGTALATAVLGAGFWALSARLVDPATIGIAGAVLSAMMLIARLGTLGLGTLVIARLSSPTPGSWAFARAAVITAGVVSAALTLAVAAAIPSLAGSGSGVLLIALLSAGAGASSAGFVLDAVFIGELRSQPQLARNLVASVSKLLLLPMLVIGLAADGLVAITAATALGAALSLVVVFAHRRPTDEAANYWPRVRRQDGVDALRHHAFNLALLAPSLLLPIVGAGILGDESGYFFIALTVSGLVWAVPESLSMALYATGARDVSLLAVRMRTTIRLSMAAGAAATVAVALLGGAVLSVFGAAYADGGALALTILTLGFIPELVLSLYVPVTRLDGTFLRGTLAVIVGSTIGLAAAAWGGVMAGPAGMAAGWVVGATVGRAILVPALARVLRAGTGQARAGAGAGAGARRTPQTPVGPGERTRS